MQENNNVPTKSFNSTEIRALKELISQKWIVFEWALIQAIESIELKDGSLLDPSGIIRWYVKIFETAMKPNPKTWVMMEDHETRMKALDKLTKIMLWQSGASKGTTVNIQNNSNLFTMNIPKPGEHLIY